MKKFLLFAAAIVAASSAFAGPNKVVNGDFEAPGAESAIPGGYTWDPWNKQYYLTVLPGWNLSKASDPWNGGIEMLSGDDWLGDGIVRPEEDTKVLRFIGFNDNGWTDVAMSQVVEGLTPGAEYSLNYLVGARFPSAEETANGWAPDPKFGFELAEVDTNVDGDQVAGKLLAAENLAERSEWENGSIDMFPVGPVTFTAPADGKAFLSIYMNNNYGDKNKKDNLWMIVDMVSITSDADGAGVAGIIAEENAPVEYFNLQGVRVANPENGLYIRRQGSKTVKVVL